MSNQPNKPVRQIRLGVTFSRGNQRDGVWHDSQSFGRDDLPRLMKCADPAYDWIFNQTRERACDCDERPQGHDCFFVVR